MRTFAPSIPPSRIDLDNAVLSAMAIANEPGVATFVVNDPQRNTDTPAVLRRFAPHLAGTKVRILVATGTHTIPDNQQQTLNAKLHDAIAFTCIEYHNSHASNLVPIGSWTGHRWLLDQGPLVAIGSVEPHYFAGFTGSHKTCTIGCASFEDIQANHSLAVSPSCRPCALDNNPVAQGIAGMLNDLQTRRPLACVNLVQPPQRVVFCAGGLTTPSLLACSTVATEVFACKPPARADALIVEVTGALGQSFYQAEKGIKNNEWACRDGGSIVLVAPCPQGIGQDHFVNLMRQAPTYAQACEMVRLRGYRLGDHKAVRLRYLTDPTCRGVNVYVVSPGLSEHDARTLGLIKTPSVAHALEHIGIPPDHHRLYKVLDAGNVCLLE